MSTTDSIVSSQAKQSSWRKSDTTWTLGLFGTAIGAGVLFFPIRAGFGGLIPLRSIVTGRWRVCVYPDLIRPAILRKRSKSTLVKRAGELSRSFTSLRFVRCCGFMASPLLTRS